MIRSLTKTMDDQKGKLVKPPKAVVEAPKAVVEEAGGADGEFNAGEEAELAKLQQEFKQLEQKVTMAGITVGGSPAKPPAAQNKGGRKGGWNSVDLRPRALQVEGIAEGVNETALTEHFGSKAVEAVTVNGGQAIVSFRTRRA